MYSELYAAWELEVDDLALHPLSTDFYANVADYVSRIRQEIRMLDESSLKAKLLEQELKNVKRIIRQLMWIRYKKIVRFMGESGKPPLDLMTPEEAKLSKGYLSSVEGYRAFVKGILQGQHSEVSVEKPLELPRKRVVLRFLRAMPAVIGGDMKTYGPFLPEDVASVPVENAKILVKQGFAVEVDIS